MDHLIIPLEAGNRKRKRPPDSVIGLSSNDLTSENQTLAEVLDTAVWLSGNELKLRVTQFYGSRNSKKRR
jgi:hypothetical protein